MQFLSCFNIMINIFWKFLLLGHHNPHHDQWPVNSTIQVNPRVKIGNYLLGNDVKDKYEDFKAFTSDVKPKLDGIKIYAGLFIIERKTY